MEALKETIEYKSIRPGQQLEIKSHRNGRIEGVGVVIFPRGMKPVHGGKCVISDMFISAYSNEPLPEVTSGPSPSDV
jgi:hypothetical protein